MNNKGKQVRLLSILFCLFMTAMNANGQTFQADSLESKMDSVDICLLTCGPGNEVYSLYGHTAIRVHDRINNTDLAINYGMFSFEQENFVLRFIFGLTDYEIGITSFERFKQEYTYEGRWIKEQVLNLSAKDKLQIISAIENNYRPENRVYRYNYFYDNCTTRARDILLDNMSEKVIMPSGSEDDITYRDIIHQWTSNHPWTRFGNDLLLGVKADVNTTAEEQQFIPLNLLYDFSKAQVYGADNTHKPLVESEQWIVKPTPQTLEESFPISPKTTFLILFIITVILTVLESRLHVSFWLYDFLLLLLTGLSGLVLFAMVFSQHPTVSLNLQILILNPLNLVFLYPVTRKLMKGQIHYYVYVYTLFLILSFFGTLIQQYAERIYILALSLLLRMLSIIYNYKKKESR